MDRRTFLSTGAIAVGSTWSPLWAANDANAAPHYRKAVTLLPELAEEESELFESLPAAPRNAVSLTLIRRSEAALRAMARGAELADCDWGPDYFANCLDFDRVPMVELSKLSKLACLRAACSFQDRQSGAAITDLIATFNIARHLGRRGPFMMTLVQYAMEHQAINVAAAYVSQQDSPTLMGLATRLERLPKSGSLCESALGEKEWLLQSLRPQYEGKNNQEAFELLRKQSFLDEKDELTAIVKRTRGDVKELLKLIDDAAQHYDELAVMSLLPRTEFSRTLSAFEKAHAPVNPYVPVDMFRKMRDAADRVAARFAMLHAAIKVVQGGTVQLKTIKDPFGDGPFTYRAFQGGFHLESAIPLTGPPVTLTIGLKKV